MAKRTRSELHAEERELRLADMVRRERFIRDREKGRKTKTAALKRAAKRAKHR